MTRRRFIADTWTEATATLTGDQAAHLARVLRAQPGQIYDVVAGGFLHRAEITHVTPEAVQFTLHEELESDTALPLHLLIAIFKFDHLEWAIEKATELGVQKITPILARRTEKHLAQAASKRAERWRRIALEASKQSRRSSIPEVADPTSLREALAAEQSQTRILLSEVEQSTSLTEALRDSQTPLGFPQTASTPVNSTDPQTTVISAGAQPQTAVISTGAQRSGETPVFALAPAITHALAIGPEGGWTPEELQLFTDYNWQPVTIGPRILRAETAAIAAIAIASAYLS